MKRIFAFALALILLFACLPAIPVSAEYNPMGRYTRVYLHGSVMEEVYGRVVSRDFIEDDIPSVFDNLFNDSGIYNTDMEVFRVKLYRDCTTADFPHFSKCNVEIDLNGHTWKVTGTPVDDYSRDFDDTEDTEDLHLKPYDHTKGNISISGGTLIFESPKYNLLYTEGGNINIRNVVFKDCFSDRRGLITVEGSESGSLQLDNVVFENCSCPSDGSCVYVDCYKGKSFQFNNCKFNNCHSKYGGAVYLAGDYCNYDFVNCEFNGCYADIDGGAIYCESEYSNVRFTNCNAYSCHANDCGGFIFCSGEHTVYNGFGAAGASTLSDRSNIMGCYALGSGGAFYSSVNASCSNGSELRNFNMVSNTAGASSHNFDAVKSRNSNSWGGAVCFRGYDMKLSYCDLIDNYGTWYGGAVYAGWSGTSIENCTFDQNRCNDGYGNDIYIDSSKGIDVKNCNFYSGNSIAGKTLRTNVGNYIGTYNKTESLMLGNDMEDGDYIIYSSISDSYALDIEGGLYAVNAEGANAHLWAGGAANLFTITKDIEKGTYIIKSKVTGMILDVADGSKENGANIRQWHDNGSDAQRWSFEPSGDGYYYIRCIGGQYMDANGGSAYNGNNVHSWEFNGTNAQKWKLVRVVDEGDYIIRSALNEKFAVDIEGGNFAVNAEGANAHLWENGDANVFTFTKDGNTGKYIVKSKVTGLVLDVSGGSYENGANIQQWGSNGTGAQRWSFEPSGDGYYYIKCTQYMDASGMVGGAKPSNGVNVQSWSFTGAPNQKWKLVKAVKDPKGTLLPNPSGDGTKENPYKISNAQTLKNFAYNVSYGETYEGKYIELTGDILLDYFPIGKYSTKNAFKGNFDGKNHTVRYIDYSENCDRGVFGYCVNATVKNVRVTGRICGSGNLAGICAVAENTTFENCINDADVTSVNDKNIAGICGIATNCKFISCTNNGAIQSKSSTAGGIAAYCTGDKTELVNCRNNGYVYAPNYDVGGMVGESLDHITFKRCVNNAEIVAGTSTASGIVGCIRKGADIYSCINTENGIIRAAENAAGMLAYEDAASHAININNCANYGVMFVGKKNGGGIVVNFNNDNLTAINCFGAASINHYNEDTATYGAIVAGAGKGTYKNCYCISGAVSDSHAVALSEKDCKDTLVNKMNTYIRNNTTSRDRAYWVYWSVDTKRGCAVPDIASVSSTATEGSGTEGDPYLISTAKHLEELNNDLRHGINHAGKYFKLTKSFSYTGEPIGAGGAQFAGNFDGDYHTLTVKIDGGTYTGLFSEMNGGCVKNLSVAGSVSGANCVGGIAGHTHDGTVIDNCHVIATVTGTAENVGGIVGMAHNTTVSNCRVDGAVKGATASVGGIAGWFHSSGRVVNCVNAGEIVGGSGVGGILGCSNGGDVKIINCSSLGSASVFEGGLGDAFGGIVGHILSDIDSMTIINCFTKCTVLGNTNRGLIIGTNDADTKVSFAELYYVSTTGEKITTGSGTAVTATKKNDANLSSLSGTLTTYASGKNEDNIPLTAWIYDSDAKHIYPKNYTYASEQILGRGTKADPYRIATAEHLIEVANNVFAGETYKGKYFRLTRNIIYDGPQIGKDGSPFCGVFDGNDHKLTVDIEADSTYIGLFSQLCGATVTNLEVSGSLEGKNCLGGIAGFAYDGTLIDNCLVSATVKGTEENCGGVVGMMDGSTVSNCRVDGAVTGAITSTGGIVGGILSGGTIVNCLSTKKVTGENNVGGILGCVLWGDPLIANCSNYAELALKRGATKATGFGGIVGYVGNEVNSVTIVSCFSYCKIGATLDRAYIVGKFDAPADVLRTDELYYIAEKTAGLPVCNGVALTATETDDIKEDYDEMASSMLNYSNRQSITDITLTTWKNDGTYFAPKNYVNLLAVAGSVFGDNGFITLAVIGVVLLALIIATAVLYVKKKKKKRP